MVMAAPSAHHGSVAIFYRKAEHLTIEDLRIHGPTFIKFQLVMGKRLWNGMGCYIAPINASTVEDVAVDIRYQPYGSELLLVGYLNANLADPKGMPRAEAIADTLAAVGLMDMGFHFLPRRK